MVQLWWVAAEEVDATNGRDKVVFSHEIQEKGKLLQYRFGNSSYQEDHGFVCDTNKTMQLCNG